MLEQEILDELKSLNQKIDRLCSSLEVSRKEQRSRKPVSASKPKTAPITHEEMQQHQIEFGEIYERWLSGDELGVLEQLEKFDVEKLRRFSDSNNLNVTSKMSKERVLHLIGARFREKKQLQQIRPLRSEDRETLSRP